MDSGEKGESMYTAQQIINARRRRWDGDIAKDKTYTQSVADYIIRNPTLLPELQERPELLIEMCFVIVDKDKKTVPFFLNAVQQDLAGRIREAKEDYVAGKRLEMCFMVLKGRQQGCTAFITAYQLACTIINRNFEGFTAADEDGNTQAIFQNKAKFFYDRLPDALKPSEKFNNRKQLLFDKLNSSWEVKTASKNIGRSRTINFFHGSECAFWRDGIAGVQAGLGEALTKSAISVYESTANGYNEYYDLWNSGIYTNLFYGWWLTDEYEQMFETQEKEKQFKADVTGAGDAKYEINQKQWIYQRCKWLIDAKGLSWGQAYWYYNKWRGKLDKNMLLQEYPCSPDEAFLSSGACIFNKEKVMQRRDYLTKLYQDKPPIRGEFVITWNDPEMMDYPVAYRWVDSPTGCIRIYEQPKPTYPYVVGGDTKGEGSDKFASTVINNNTGNRCATLHGEMSSKAYAAQTWALGMYYNTALIGIEANFNTYPIELLTDWHYPRQYVRERTDTFTKEVKKAYGWRTDGNTRPLIIEMEITEVDEHIDCFHDLETLGEMLTFVKDEKGRPDAEAGKHDDALLSDMIASGIRGQQTHVVTQEAVDADEDDEEETRGADNWFN
jgi:hypothetical protein